MNIADVYFNRQPDIMDLKIGDIVYIAEDPYKILKPGKPYPISQIAFPCLLYRGGTRCGSLSVDLECRYGGYNFGIKDNGRGRVICICEVVNERGIPYKRRH